MLTLAMASLKSEYLSIEEEIKELKEKQNIVYHKMVDQAELEGSQATSLPYRYVSEDLDFSISNHRKIAYLRLHQDECSHGTIVHKPNDGRRYGTCANCDKVITQEDKDNFIDI